MELTGESQENSMTGRRIGVYELQREIGRGGMGAVYLASRVDGEFRQRVAIKLIKRGMDTDLILKRFRRERQIIAALDHPNIVYFLGGDSTEDGLPYFVMEYIEGKSLYQFCDHNKLTINERLRIFLQVCGAVEAAHQKKVIHRDLKPSNILVKSDGTPKLLDFGIAKVLDPELAVTDIDPTATAMRVLTPEYASPEQVAGEKITPASDIYSLGVVLYELLSGHRPYQLKRRVAHEVARIICEEMPSRPSHNLTDADNLVPTGNHEKTTLEFVFDSRRASPTELQNALSGDLDKVVLKALRKNPAERYQSAFELAEDISNYLENRPVKAENFFPGEQIKRQKNNVSIAILPFKVIGKSDDRDEFLGIGLADALVSRLSGVQRLIVRPTSSALPFATENPLEAGNKLNVDVVLDGNIRRVGERIRISVQLLDIAKGAARWAEKFDESFTDVLELEDLISERVAKVLLPQITGEERRRLEKRGTNKPEAYQAYLRGRYFWSQFTDESFLKAVEAFQEAVSIDSNYALPHVGIADFYNWSAIFGMIPSREACVKAQRAGERALEIDNSLGEAYSVLAFSNFLYEWNWAEFERLIKRALELSPNYSLAHEYYSNFLAAQGRFDEAIDEIKRAEELDPFSPRAKLMTSWTLYQARRFRDGLIKAEQANEMQTHFPQGLLHLGSNLNEIGKIDEAIAALSESSRLWQGSALPKYMLCFALVAGGKTEEARRILNEILSAAEKSYVSPYFIAMSYVAFGEIDDAFKWFEKAVEQNSEWMIWFGTEPKLDILRKDPRYIKLLRRTKNPIISEQQRPFSGETTTGGTEKSIAVLPFKFLSAANIESSEDEYLSIGLADALTMRLSNVRRFLVRPTSSVLPFGEIETDPFAAGRELGVDFVVDGNIRRVGERIRVAAQLLNVGENSTRWAGRFDENSTDVLALEDSISEKVTKSLLPKLTGEERRQLSKRGTNNAEAYEAYLRGRFFWNQFTPDALSKAIVSFQKAVTLDPEYALAYAGIADFYTWAAIYGMMPPSESFPKVYTAAKRALEIDDTLSEAYAAIGLYYSNMREWIESEKNYHRAIKLNPNYSHAHEWLSAILVGTGRFEDGIREIKLAESLDPFSLRAKTLTAWTAYQARDFDLALSKSLEIIQLNPHFAQGHLQLSNVLLALGRNEEALEACRKGVALMPDSPLPIYQLCFALTAVGKLAEAREQLSNLKNKATEIYVSPYFLAMSYVAVGEIELALEYFEQVIDEYSAWVLWFGTEPMLDNLRRDERFLKLLNISKNPIGEKFIK